MTPEQKDAFYAGLQRCIDIKRFFITAFTTGVGHGQADVACPGALDGPALKDHGGGAVRRRYRADRGDQGFIDLISPRLTAVCPRRWRPPAGPDVTDTPGGPWDAGTARRPHPPPPRPGRRPGRPAARLARLPGGWLPRLRPAARPRRRFRFGAVVIAAVLGVLGGLGLAVVTVVAVAVVGDDLLAPNVVDGTHEGVDEASAPAVGDALERPRSVDHRLTGGRGCGLRRDPRRRGHRHRHDAHDTRLQLRRHQQWTSSPTAPAASPSRTTSAPTTTFSALFFGGGPELTGPGRRRPAGVLPARLHRLPRRPGVGPGIRLRVGVLEQRGQLGLAAVMRPPRRVALKRAASHRPVGAGGEEMS